MNSKSLKVKVAVCAMINLANRHHLGPVKSEDMAARQGISLSYMDQIISKLSQAGLIKSRKGPGGGYKAASLAITIDEIIVAIAGPRPELKSADEYNQRVWAEICQAMGKTMKMRKLRDYTL